MFFNTFQPFRPFSFLNNSVLVPSTLDKTFHPSRIPTTDIYKINSQNQPVATNSYSPLLVSLDSARDPILQLLRAEFLQPPTVLLLSIEAPSSPSHFTSQPSSLSCPRQLSLIATSAQQNISSLAINRSSQQPQPLHKSAFVVILPPPVIPHCYFG